MQNAGFPNKRNGKLLRSRDGNQFVVKNTGEGEQIVALILQRDAHRADTSCILGLPAHQFSDVSGCEFRSRVNSLYYMG